MEKGAADVGERRMNITQTFEEWKANKRVTGEEGKLNLPVQRVFFPSFLPVMALVCRAIMTGGG